MTSPSSSATDDLIVWKGERENRVRRTLGILGPASPRFAADDARAMLAEIGRLNAELHEATS